MFSRISRYRNLPDVNVEDAGGRTLASKSLRLLPDVNGTFQHTVEDGSRHDHLGFKYYQQPRKFWRICDGNPQILSPFELLARGPLITVRFPLEESGAEPPWANIARRLSVEPGVDHFSFADDIEVTPEPQTIGGEQFTVNVEHHTFSVLVSYNQLVVGSAELSAILAAEGLLVEEPEVMGQVGQRITVPPDVLG